ncbi:LuxR family transcriptional regulator [Amycolatopsis sp. 195334CR]|uniref:helix-turn-helix transcriptional regulator n=1 Tax=Amycolatopsis sp. 195334CR TaxID=2814588 RepID=UPI001A8D039B|nr:LuxR family transcriptional regulator [Amycolatopsis sp. 195334CR]MBN6040624.1 AAA family ATPase [Amycolatopsis sp. 195334CR]
MVERTEVPGDSGVLIGRSGELGALARLAAAARDGEAGLVVLSGPSGIGKSSLLRAFTAQAAADGMRVLHGTCGEVVAGTGYGGAQALFGSLELTGDSPLLRGGARRALVALADEPGDPSSTGADYPALHGLYWLAVNLMADGPLVLALDDVHWCDERSLRWLEFLMRRADTLPLLVVLALRTEIEPVAPGALADISAQPRSLTVGVGPLADADVATMIGREFPGRPDESFVHNAAVVSGGNPLVLTRLLQELRELGVAADREGARRVTEVGRYVVATSVRATLDSKPDWVRDIAIAVAVLGDHGEELLGALAGVPSAQVETALEVLRGADILAADRIEPVHDVVRSAVLDSISPADLAALRVRAASLLSDAGRPAEDVANLLLLVPDVTQPWMAGVLRAAAARAELRGAPEAAIRYLYRVLEAEPESVPVRLQLARSLVEIDPPKGAALLREALVLALDVRTRAMVAVQFGMTCLHVQSSPEAVRVLSEVLDALDLELGPDPDPADRELRTHVESALLLTGVDEKATIAPIRERVAKMTPPPGDTPAQRQLLGTMTVVTAMDGTSPELAVEQARRAMRAPGVTLGGWSLLSSALALSFADEVGDCMDALERVLDHARENAAVRTYVLTLSFRAFIMHGLGELADAISDAQVSLDVSRGEPWGDAVTMPPTALAAGLIDRGEPVRAEELLAGVVRTDLDRFVWEYHWFLMTRARARWALGDADTALSLFDECGRSLTDAGLVNPAFVPWWVESACVLADTRRPGDAAGIVDHGEELARRWGTPRVLGLAALARGVITPGTAGIDLLAEAAALLARSPARLEQARAEFRLGQALLEAGYSERARGHLRTAADLARRCGALALARSARRGLLAAGGRMREITESPVDMLTGTERKVAALAVAGSSNRMIAESLFVTVRTVESHLTNVYRKLGVGSRAELDTALADMPASLGGPVKRVLS